MGSCGLGTEKGRYSRGLQALGLCSWGIASEKLVAQQTCSISAARHAAALLALRAELFGRRSSPASARGCNIERNLKQH